MIGASCLCQKWGQRSSTPHLLGISNLQPPRNPHALHHLVGHLCIFNDLGLHLSLSLRVGWWLGGCEMICGLSPYPQKMMRKWRNPIIIHYHLWMDGWMDGWMHGWYYPKIFHSMTKALVLPCIANVILKSCTLWAVKRRSGWGSPTTAAGMAKYSITCKLREDEFCFTCPWWIVELRLATKWVPRSFSIFSAHDFRYACLRPGEWRA